MEHSEPLILLASGSARRWEILRNLGYRVQKVAVEIDETPLMGEAVADFVARMAWEKNVMAQGRLPDSLDAPLLTADTCVACEGQILGKPKDEAEAYAMLRLLSGRVHQVLTAVCVFYRGQMRQCTQISEVRFKDLSEQEIQNYLATGEAWDKAGAYGIQGLASVFVAHLSGSYSGVMGLPIFETVALLREQGYWTPPYGVSR